MSPNHPSIPPDLENKVRDLMAEIFARGYAECKKDLASFFQVSGPLFETQTPKWESSQKVASSLKTGAGTRPGTAAYEVKQFILKSSGKTRSEIKNAILPYFPHSKPKAIYTALERLKEEGTIKLVNGLYYGQEQKGLKKEPPEGGSIMD